MTTGSVCTGYSGLDRAVHEVIGGELAWVADNDEGAAKILAYRYPDVPNLGDITTVDWSAVEPVDVFTAGFPCQDISCAGRRAGLREGNRSGLWFHVARAIAELRPPMVVIENVKELLSERADSEMEPCPWCMGDGGEESAMRALGAVLADLAALGFDAEWISVPASAAGACHLRWRVFILAWPAENSHSAAGSQWRFAAPGETQGGRPRADAGRSGGAFAADTGRAGLEIGAVERYGSERPAAQRGRDYAPADTERDRLQGNRAAARPDAGRAPAPGVGCGPADGSVASPWGQPGAFGKFEAAVRRHERAFGRSAPAPVEPGRNGKSRLAPHFVEWMQGLPDGWVTAVPGLSRKDQLHALGNGVVPAQAAMALRLLLDRADIPSVVAAEEVA